MAWFPRRACVVVASLSGTCLIGLTAVAAPPATLPATRPAAPATRPAVPATRPAAAPATKPAALNPPATLPATKPTTAPARPAAAKPAGPEPLPTPDELRALFDDGKYNDVLKHLRAITVLRGPAAQPYNKYEMLILRAETQLRLKASAAAIASFTEASEATDDPQKAAYGKAVAMLLRKARNNQYQPSPQKKERPPPVDVVEPDSRRTALQAMLADEMAVVGPKVEKALDGHSLPGIAEGLAAVQGLDVLELGVGGGDEARQMINDLRTRGLALMAQTLQVMITRTDEIARTANEVIRYSVPAFDRNGQQTEVIKLRKRGLQNEDYRDLKEIGKTVDMIIPNAKGLIQKTGGKQREVEDLITAAEELKRKADKTLKADYSQL